jgi:integrase
MALNSRKWRAKACSTLLRKRQWFISIRAPFLFGAFATENGKDSANLVFTSLYGEIVSPTVLSVAFMREVCAVGIKRTKFHGLRHLHITHLLRSGVPVHVVSARAGHARPSVTLDTYAHLLGAEDENAAKLADDMLRRALK